jgi:hypothetical protein
MKRTGEIAIVRSLAAAPRIERTISSSSTRRHGAYHEVTHYNAVCSYALLGDIDAALKLP